MKLYLRSSSSLTGLFLSLGLCAACSSAPSSPLLSKDKAIATVPYNGNGDSQENAEPSDGGEETQDSSPSSNPSAGGENPAPVKPASVSVSLNAVNPSTLGESFFGRGLQQKDGSLILSYGQDGDAHTLKTEISKDDGLSWQALGEIVNEPLIPNIPEGISEQSIAVLPSGTLLSVYRNRLPDNTFRLQASASFDGGKTWNFQGDIDVTTTGDLALFPALFINAKGQAQVYYSKAKTSSGGDLVIYMRTSPDEGKTWNNQTTVAARSSGSVAFPSVTRLKDGSLLAVFDSARGDLDTHQILRYVQSKNEGQTWTSAQDVYIPADGQRRAQSPQLTILDDGRPVVVFMSDEGNPAGQSNFGIKLIIAKNVASFGDVQWLPQPVTAIATTAGVNTLAPGVIPAKDGTFFLTYEKARKTFLHRVTIKGGL